MLVVNISFHLAIRPQSKAYGGLPLRNRRKSAERWPLNPHDTQLEWEVRPHALASAVRSVVPGRRSRSAGAPAIVVREPAGSRDCPVAPAARCGVADRVGGLSRVDSRRHGQAVRRDHAPVLPFAAQGRGCRLDTGLRSSSSNTAPSCSVRASPAASRTARKCGQAGVVTAMPRRPPARSLAHQLERTAIEDFDGGDGLQSHDALVL